MGEVPLYWGLPTRCARVLVHSRVDGFDGFEGIYPLQRSGVVLNTPGICADARAVISDCNFFFGADDGAVFFCADALEVVLKGVVWFLRRVHMVPGIEWRKWFQE